MNYLKTKAFQNHPLKSNIPVCIGGVNHKNWFQNYYDYSKLDKWTIFRNLAKDYGLEVQMRLEWMIFYEKVSKRMQEKLRNIMKFQQRRFTNGIKGLLNQNQTSNLYLTDQKHQYTRGKKR